MRFFKERSSLLAVLSCLTLLNILFQLAFFLIHSHVSELVDYLISSSIANSFFNAAILLPIIEFVAIQMAATVLLVAFIWFITVLCSEFFGISAYGLGIIVWLLANLAVYTLNCHFFPDSFFAGYLRDFAYTDILMWITVSIMLFAVMVAYYQGFSLIWRLGKHKPAAKVVIARPALFLGAAYLILAILILSTSSVNNYLSQDRRQTSNLATKPNIILIGLDSLRPDFTGYFGNTSLHTPHIDVFLKNALSFRQAYTPLARTFPSWVSILTAKYPKHNHARINLGYAAPIVGQDSIAKELKNAGYTTIYATDEKRFSNITQEYGFDQIIGPKMGIGDFILGSLSDFPLSNLMINLPPGRFLFPFNYGNRAAAITYEPDTFMQLLRMGLHQRQDKPLFLAVHFCVSHWPYTWARDLENKHKTMDQRYRSSVEQVDAQLGELLQILKENALLDHSLLVLLSDHGTTFGLPGDRLIDKQHYLGDKTKLKWVPRYKLGLISNSSLDLEKKYSLNTAYGQGTDVLSLKQYQILLGFRYYGDEKARIIRPRILNHRSSLLDIVPTILAFLELQPMKNMDGTSLLPYLRSKSDDNVLAPFYLETGHSVSDIETNNIEVDKVVKHTIKLYRVNPQNGQLYVNPAEEKAVLKSKQRAVIIGPWLLARYPSSIRTKLVISGVRKNRLISKSYVLPAYYVLANINTSEWTVGFDSILAKKAPLRELKKKFKEFYGDEV